ncbi:hypothetical protein TWF569_009349 [Orbilia oligospora]|uniref:Uncharacterized protein n=1 Tax=Orbilia oligospora TaxID=2813651 RepID=A0A7C8J090_ORBOL|nr:hypothetical protein TWF102_011596 [Orbilia oligospora]KAF3094634.1 hypothetical protein TWF706_008470 [Orbilia oligospora]KAF3096465.1 hypothetical protein TWF103_009800 [Orbilia oligospora]KAF3136075.1 hypothetical protein TWF594_008048 [Orbilia oligospora]KAF3137069.1 hypothetical protein TWF569_009349 [Orbilia oligospora]
MFPQPSVSRIRKAVHWQACFKYVDIRQNRAIMLASRVLWKIYGVYALPSMQAAGCSLNEVRTSFGDVKKAWAYVLRTSWKTSTALTTKHLSYELAVDPDRAPVSKYVCI